MYVCKYGFRDVSLSQRVSSRCNALLYKRDYLQPDWKCKSFSLSLPHLAEASPLRVPVPSSCCRRGVQPARPHSSLCFIQNCPACNRTQQAWLDGFTNQELVSSFKNENVRVVRKKKSSLKPRFTHLRHNFVFLSHSIVSWYVTPIQITLGFTSNVHPVLQAEVIANKVGNDSKTFSVCLF